MKNESEPRAQRGQRDYRLPFKLAVVGEVGRGEWSYKQRFSQKTKNTVR